MDGVENALCEVGFENTLHDPKRVVFAAIAESGEPIEIVWIMVEQVGEEGDDVGLGRGGAI